MISRTLFTFVVLLGAAIALAFGISIIWRGYITLERSGQRVTIRGNRARALGIAIIVFAVIVALLNFLVVLPSFS